MNINVSSALYTLPIFAAPIVTTLAGDKVISWWPYVIIWIVLNILMIIVDKIFLYILRKENEK